MANNVTVTPAAAKMVYASGSTDFITVSGNVSGSSNPSYGVGGLHVTSDQTNSFGLFIHNKKAGGGNQYAKVELASEDDNLMVYHTWDNSAGGLGAQRFTQTVGETRTIFEGRSASNQLYLASGGNIGMGTVPATDIKLHVDGTLRTSGKATFMAGTLPTNNGIRVNDTIELPQQAGDPTYVANAGVVWVKSTSPTTLWFTASDGTDTDLTAGGGIGGSVSDTYIPIATAADTLGNFMPAYVENTNMIMGVTPASITTDADGNTAYGHLAGQGITTGDNNVLMGYRAGISLTTGVANVFLGASAGYAATTSSYNNFIGYNAGSVGTRGNQNVGMGYYAMATNQGANNVAIGHNTMEGEAGADNDATVAIGAYALRNLSGTADMNTAVGYGAMQGASTGLTDAAQYNVAIGHSSMGGLTGGYSNVAMGRDSLLTITTGYENTAVGTFSMSDNTTGKLNVAIGAYAATGNTTGQENVAVGASALQENQEGDDIVAVGRYALYNMNPSAGAGDSVGIGSNAGFSTTTGVQNVFIGRKAGYSNTTASNHVIIGREAGYSNQTGANSVVIGMRAGYYGTGDGNHFVGYLSGFGNASTNNGTYNTALGYEALKVLEDADENVAIGSQALRDNTSGDGNTAVGTNALYRNTTASHNVAVGHRAMFTSTTANQNVAVGRNSAYALTDGTDNTVVGYQALRSGASADGNTAIGKDALFKVTDGGENVAIGKNAGYSYAGGSNLIGSFSTFIGYGAGYGVVGGISYGSNIAIGHQTLYTGTNANRTVAVGNSAGVSGTASVDNVLVGYGAGSYADSTGNTYVGNKAGFRSNGNYNTVMGYRALSGSSSGDTSHNNVAIGYVAMEDSSAAVENVVIGTFAGTNMTTASYNTIVGPYAGRDITAGNRNVAMGYAAMNEYKQTGDGYNVSIGMYSMMNVETGSANIAIGYQALRGVTGQDVDYNVAIGEQALYAITTGDNNVAVGRQAGVTLTTGGDNVMLGYQAGENVSTASATTLLGYKAGYSNNANSLIAVGKNAGYSNSSGGNNTFVGFSAGHSNDTGASNTMIGYQAGYPMNASRSVVIGTNAGVAANSATADSVLMGVEAGYSTAGTGQVAVGRQAIYHSEGNYNTAVGDQAMHGSSTTPTAYNMVSIGRRSFFNVQSGHSSVALGVQAGYSTTTGYSNVFLGQETGYSNTTGAGNTYLGNQAGFSGSTGNNNIFIGNAAGLKNTSGDNVAIGSEAYLSGSSATQIVAIGRNAGKGITTGQGVIAIGPNAAQENEDGTHNVAIGWQAMMGAAGTADRNVGIGTSTLLDISTGESNVGVGYQAGQNISTGDFNIAIGNNALRTVTTYASNVAVGHNAGYSVNQADNVMIGSLSGYDSESSGSTLVGFQAGYFPHGNNNTFIGYKSGKGASSTTTAHNNVAMGTESLLSVTSGGENVALGDQAGYGITTADYCVAVGSDALRSVTTGFGNIGIGRYAGSALGVDQYTVAIGSSAAQDATTSESVLIGQNAGYSLTGDGNVGIGKGALFNVTSGGGNVAIGKNAGPSSTNTDSNKLYINNAAGTPLIGGDFSAGEVTINASSKSITLDPYFVVSGDNQYSMISGSAGLALYGGNSYTDIWIDGQNSRQLRLRSVASDGSFDAGSFLEVFPSSVGATGDATANIRASSGDLYLYSIGSNNIGIDSHHNIQMFFDNEYNMYSAADGNTRFTIRAASVAGMEFDGSSKIAFKNAASTKMTLDTANGRLGIGTTAPDEKLDVRGDIQLKQTGDTAVTVLGDANRSGADSHIAALRGKWNGTAVGTFMVMSGPDTTNKDDGQLTFQTASAGTLAERMRIDETGNIGIGTTTPLYPLQVMGEIALGVAGNTYTGDRIKGATGKIQFIANGGTQATLDGTGLGLGTTSPIQPLHVLTSANDKGILIDVSDNTHEGRLIFGDVASNGIGHIGYNHALEAMRFNVGGAEMLRLDSANGVAKFYNNISFDADKGITNQVGQVTEWLPNALGNNNLDGNITGEAKIQSIVTDNPAINWMGMTTAKLNLPAAAVGREYIINWASTTANLSGKTFSLNPVGSDALYKGGVSGPVGFNKLTGESIHVICAEAGIWSVVAHT
jgi:hypothetical protein